MRINYSGPLLINPAFLILLLSCNDQHISSTKLIAESYRCDTLVKFINPDRPMNNKIYSFSYNLEQISGSGFRYRYFNKDSTFEFILKSEQGEYTGITNVSDSFRMDLLFKKTLEAGRKSYKVQQFWNRSPFSDARIVYYFVDGFGLVMTLDMKGLRHSNAEYITCSGEKLPTNTLTRAISDDPHFKTKADSIYKIKILFTPPKGLILDESDSLR